MKEHLRKGIISLSIICLLPFLFSCGSGGGGGGEPVPAKNVGTVTVASGSATIVADGITTTSITATVIDTDGNNMPDGTVVNFTTTAGTLSAPTAGTANGVATVNLTSSTSLGTATVTAEAGGVSDNTTVQFVPGPVAAIALTATPDTLNADGASTSNIRAFVTDANGHAVADGEVISFAVTTGTGTLSAPTAATSGGAATVTYTASYTAGAVTITAQSANGTTNTVNLTLNAAPVGTVTVAAGSANIVADGVSGTVIRATVKDTNNNNVADGTVVTFTTTAGALSAATATTTSGVATVTLTSSTIVGFATVTASTGGVSGNTTVNFVPGAPSAISLSATPNNLTADGASTSTIRAVVTDANGNAVSNGEVISFSITTGTGTLSAPTANTSGGVATVTYMASFTAGTTTIRAQAASGASDTVNITLVGAAVGAVTLSAGSASIVADGVSTSLIRAVVKDTNNNNVADGTTVSFTTTAGILSAGSATTTNGAATVTLTSPTLLGTATITATVGGVNDTTTVNFVAGPVASVGVTANPSNLTADGASTSTIQATVTDANANPVANESITFSAVSGNLTEASATTNANGIATVTYTAPGTVPAGGTDTVTATSTNNTTGNVTITIIAASVGTVTVTAGSASIVADGASSTIIRAEVKDTNGNNIADGTTVDFVTTAGILSAGSATTTNGVASLTLTSGTNLATATIRATAGGVSNTTTVNFVAGPAAQVVVRANPSNLTADGTSQSTIHVTVLDGNDNPVADGEVLTFNANDGQMSSITATTSGGMATNTYTAPNYVPASGNDTITVEASNGQTGTALITLIGAQIATISLSANPTSLPADGSTQATISATLTVVGGGAPPDGTAVSFSITQGGGSITATASTSGGTALATLTSGTTAETATIRAESGGRNAEVQVEYTPGSVTLTITPNSVLGTGQETATVVATLKTAAGAPAVGETVNFTVDDLTLGTVSPSSALSNAQGEAQVTFTAAAKGGTATVTGTWNTGGVDVTGSETIDIQPPPAFIEMAAGSPDPATISIKGTGGQSTSQITFDVKDTGGDLVADGYRIDFTIDSGPNGGENIIPLSATTVNGQVSTILYSGFKSGPVSIKAVYYHDTTISTTTSQIIINAGPPVGEEFGIAAEFLNISGLERANLKDGMTVNAADVYGNAIPDNTAVAFKTYNTGGWFESGSGVTTNGTATDNLVSGGTYLQPQGGFVSVTAEAVGSRTTHVTSLAVTPGNPDVMYAGTNGGGVYKSIDAGATWENIARSDESLKWGQNWLDPYIKGNNAIAVDPDDPDVVYVATGYLGRGNVYRSLDGGRNWTSNNVEEWYGIASADAACLTVLADDGGSDYVWLGTEGLGALLAADGASFQWGGWVDTGPTCAGTCGGAMSTPTLSATSVSEWWTATYVVPSASATVPVAGESNTGNGTMSNVTTDPSATETEDWTVTYQAGAGAVTPGGGNVGNGTVFGITANQPSAATETWTLTCFDATTAGAEKFTVSSSVAGVYPTAEVGTAYEEDAISFTIIAGSVNYAVGDTFTFTVTANWTVSGTVSGAQTNKATTGVAYTSDNNEIQFTITEGSIPFAVDDEFTFSTTAAANAYWNVTGSISGLQRNRAYNGIAYTSDNNEVRFTITEVGGFAAGDTWTFHVTESGLGYGKIVRDMVKAPSGPNGAGAVLYAATGTGVFRSANGGLTWTAATSFTGDNVNTLAIHPNSTGGVTDIIYGGTEDAGVWVSTDSGASWTQYASGLGKGLSATTPVPDRDNTGNGVMSDVTVGTDAVSEYWTVTCTAAAPDSGTFQVEGTVSGVQAATATVGALYTSDGGEISFTISDGSTDFAVGDEFTFSTTRDPGRTIKDLLVDAGNNLLYVITYFFGPLEPHAVGNVYVHALNADGTMGAGGWAEANTNLPQYEPPNDTTLFAQHVLAGNDPDPLVSAPTALFIGGEGINLYKAGSGLGTGAPAWQASKSGLTNLIMARMPILFSGPCTMSITENRDGDVVTFTVYIQDTNGNPPIVDSTFTVIKNSTIELLNVTYPDCYTHQGTWRDPSDASTDNPYVISTAVEEDDEIVFTFIPANTLPDAPGSSGSTQKVTRTY